MIKMIIKRITYMALLLSLINSIYRYSQNNNLFIIKSVIVDGNNYIDTDELLNQVFKDNQNNIFSYDIKKLEKKIKELNPFIKNVQIDIIIPEQIHINILEREPVALVVNNDNSFFIDSYNQRLPINSKSINHYPVPIIDIKTNQEWDCKNNSIQLIQYLIKNYSSLYQNLSEMKITTKKITLITDYKTKIFINPNKILDNIHKLKQFEYSINEFKQINDHLYIDLQYDNQVVVKEKKKYS